MTQPVPAPGPELDAEVWTLLGFPRPPREKLHSGVGWWWDSDDQSVSDWCPKPISTDWGTAMAALELWRIHGDKVQQWRWWELIVGIGMDDVADPHPIYKVRLFGSGGCGTIRGTTPQHAIALALRAALGGGE